MKKREITGISIERDLLKLATITVVKDKIRVTGVQTIKLNDPVIRKHSSAIQTSGDFDQDSDDSIFGLDEDVSLASTTSDTKSGSDDWDMTEEGVGTEYQQGSNAVQFGNIMTSLNPKVVNLALTIPMGYTYMQIIDKIDPKKIGKKRFNEDIKGTLHTLYNHDVPDEHMRYYLRQNKTLLLASIDSEIPALKLVDDSTPFYKGKLNVRDIVPEESLLIGLVRSNYEILDHQYTCIVHVEDQTTRIIFMHGREFHSILPEITEGSNSNKVVNTIFSKILFEVDRGKIPTLDRIIITGSTVKGTLQQFLTDQFLDVEINEFEFSGEKVEVLETVAGEYKKYKLSIGAAWSALDTQRKDFIPLSFVPKYVLTRQQVFKLNWHGYILLALIAATPMVLNIFYIQKRDIIQDNTYTISQIEQQTEQVRIIANEVDRLAAEYTKFNTQVQLLDTLSYNSLKWSRTLTIVNAASQSIEGYWLRSIQSSGENLVVQGTSLHRDRIPQLSNQFETAIIQQVTEREYRGVTLYDFTILVTQVVSDYRFFKPDPVELPEDLLKLQEVSATGTIEY